MQVRSPRTDNLEGVDAVSAPTPPKICAQLLHRANLAEILNNLSVLLRYCTRIAIRVLYTVKEHFAGNEFLPNTL